MQPDKKSLLVAWLLVTVGIGWLLTALKVAPGIDWVWTLGLAVVGMLTFVIGGFDKITVVVGPFFIVASTLSILRQTNRMRVDIEVPLLVILSGVLLLIARRPNIPLPGWLERDKKVP